MMDKSQKYFFFIFFPSPINVRNHQLSTFSIKKVKHIFTMLFFYNTIMFFNSKAVAVIEFFHDEILRIHEYKRDFNFFHNSQSINRDWIISQQKNWKYDFNLKININTNIFYFRCVNHFACSSCDQKMTVKTKFYEVDLKPVCKVSTLTPAHHW